MRRSFITHPRYQIGFVLAFVRGVLVAMAIPGFMLFFTLYLLAQDPSLTFYQKAILLEGSNRMVMIFFKCATVTAGVFALIAAYLSYKYAGPIRRIEDWLVQYVTHAFAHPLTLRPRDELSTVAKLLNRILER